MKSNRFSPRNAYHAAVRMSLDKAIKGAHKLPRVYIQPLETQSGHIINKNGNQQFHIDNVIQLYPNILHYLKNVLRLKLGDYFRIFNEVEGEYLCTFEMSSLLNTQDSKINSQNKMKYKSSHESEMNTIVKYKLKDSPLHIPSSSCNENNLNTVNIPITLYFVPIKKPRLKQMIESCTEIGIKYFRPVISQNCNVEYKDKGKDGTSTNSLYEQLKPLLIETIEQSEQFQIPIVYNSIDLLALLNNWINESSSSSSMSLSSINIPPLFICCERLVTNNKNHSVATTHSHSIHSLSMIETIEKTLFLESSTFSSTISTSTTTATASIDSRYKNPSKLRHLTTLPSKCGILIGPEGGFTQQEIQLFQSPVYASFVHFISFGTIITDYSFVLLLILLLFFMYFVLLFMYFFSVLLHNNISNIFIDCLLLSHIPNILFISIPIGPEILRAETAAVYAVSVVKSVITKYQTLYTSTSESLENVALASNDNALCSGHNSDDITTASININNNNNNNPSASINNNMNSNRLASSPSSSSQSEISSEVVTVEEDVTNNNNVAENETTNNITAISNDEITYPPSEVGVGDELFHSLDIDSLFNTEQIIKQKQQQQKSKLQQQTMSLMHKNINIIHTEKPITNNENMNSSTSNSSSSNARLADTMKRRRISIHNKIMSNRKKKRI